MNGTDVTAEKIGNSVLYILVFKIKKCTICHGITENDPCMICSSTERDESTLCVVENAYDIFVFEKTNILSDGATKEFNNINLGRNKTEKVVIPDSEIASFRLFDGK